MGGRGRTSGLDNKQIHIKQYIELKKIQDIKEKSEQIRESSEINSKGAVSPRLYKRCYCCNNFTIPINSIYEICPICGWIDDEYQNTHPDSFDGVNEMCLNQAREKYKMEG